MKRRTQIYLDDAVYRNLQVVADRRNISVSEVIRDRIGKPPSTTKRARNAREFLDGLAALGRTMNWKSTPRNLSERIDEFVYGAPKK